MIPGHLLITRFIWRVLCVALALISSATAQQSQKLFDTVRDGVFQVRIINKNTDTTAAIGTGFFVAENGLAVTNFHVISDVVHEPEKYRAEYLGDGDKHSNAEVLAVDVINDLAVISTKIKPSYVLHFYGGTVKKGEPIFAVGNPFDLGTTIVEGSYSGTVSNSLFERIHFTGSLNPGMSGGPTVNARGEVIGVNVATSGEQISFLVASRFVTQLIAGLKPNTIPDKAGFTEQIRLQLTTMQEQVFAPFLQVEMRTVELGRFRVPEKILPFLSCWGDSTTGEELNYDLFSFRCSNDEYVYLSRGHYTQLIEFYHDYVDGKALNDWAFTTLYEDNFALPRSQSGGVKEDVTSYRCKTDFVAGAGVTLRTAFCTRGLKKYPRLYDVVVRAATMERKNSGLLTEIKLGAVSMDNAIAVAKHFLNAITWKK